MESVRLEERYVYRQEISASPHSEMAAPPIGKIEIRLPYDGDTYFTRKAYADVTRARGRARDGATALVGYLALSGYGHTDLDSVLDLAETYGSIPIRIPARAGEPGPPRFLIDDRSTCVISCAYHPHPDGARAKPVNVSIDLLDPDSAGSFAAEGSGQTVEGIMQQVSFRPELLLRMTVTLDVPDVPDVPGVPGVPAGPPPGDLAQLARATVGWPAITSLRDLRLTVRGGEHPVRYNPAGRCLEWLDVPMRPAPGPPGGGRRSYTSGPMELSIPRPGELYQQPRLAGSVEVTVGRLLSGVQARLFGAAGTIPRRPRPVLASRVSSEFGLVLGDEFAKRTLTPYQHLHFDEVVPTEMRISDIKIALVNRGFQVTDLGPAGGPHGRWLSARRDEGPDELRLSLYVEGTPREARRDSRVPGGVTYRSSLESGEIRIYIRGALPRTSQPVVHEINALRRALRERFDHLPAKR